MQRGPGELSQAAFPARTRLLLVDGPEVGQALGHSAASSPHHDLARLFGRHERCCGRARDAVVAAAVQRFAGSGTRAADGVLPAVRSGVDVVVLLHDRHHERHGCFP